MGLGQYNSLGVYCDPHTASSVLLILLHPVTEKLELYRETPVSSRKPWFSKEYPGFQKNTLVFNRKKPACTFSTEKPSVGISPSCLVCEQGGVGGVGEERLDRFPIGRQQ